MPAFHRRMTRLLLLPLGLLAGACAGEPRPPDAARASIAEPVPSPAPAADSAALMDRFPLSICPVCDAHLGSRGEALDVLVAGRPLRVCSDPCLARFNRDPRAALARADALLIADQLPHYPLTTSLLDGRPLPDRPVDFIWGNRLFRAADADEQARILADPASAIRALDRAVIAAQRPSYAMPDKCPVQGDILPNEARIDIVVANRMIRVCCGRCARIVKARPYQYLAMIDFANREAAAALDADHSRPSTPAHDP